jgi:hypothetical protein
MNPPTRYIEFVEIVRELAPHYRPAEAAQTPETTAAEKIVIDALSEALFRREV